MSVYIWNQFVDKIQVLLRRAFDFWWNDDQRLRSVQSLSRVWLSANPWTTARRLPCPLPTPRAYSNSCPLSWWCHPTISSSVFPFSSCLQSFPYQVLFQCVSSLHQVVHVLEFQHQSFRWIFRVDYLWDWLVGSLSSPSDSQESSPTAQFKSINSSVLSFLYGPTLTSIHDYWKSHSFDYMDVCQKSNVSAF